MPTLNKRQSEPIGEQSHWFIRTPGSEHPYTFQIRSEGYQWLVDAGLGHQTDVDWDIFETLRALDLLYTLDSPYDPGDAPVPESITFDHLDAEQRVALALSLLRSFSITDLCSREGTLQFLLSIGDLDWEYQSDVLEQVVTDTPFTPTVFQERQNILSQYAGIARESAAGYNPVLLALICRTVYDAIERPLPAEQITEAELIWGADCWRVYVGSELAFYTINDAVEAAVPECLVDELFELPGHYVGPDTVIEFLQTEFSALSIAQSLSWIRELNPTLSDIIGNGLDTDEYNSILILPSGSERENGPYKRSQYNIPVPGPGFRQTL